MKFIPKSLLGRTALFVIFLVILTQLATTFVIQSFYTQPLQDRLVNDRVNQIKTLINSLGLLNDEQRPNFIENIRINEHATIVSDKLLSPPPEAVAAKQERLVYVENRLKKEVSPDSKIYISDSQTIPKIWIYLITNHGNYWYVTERLPFDADFPVRWTIALFCLVLLSLIGLFFGVRHLIQPINRLTEAAQTIAKGQIANTVPEHQGPEEIRTLSRIFNDMQDSLEEVETNRAVMLAGVSHDLRTPLSRLRLAIELSHLGDDKNTELMIQDLEEIDSTLNQFLDYARIQNEHWLTQSDLNYIVRKVSAYIASTGQPIDVQLSPDIASIMLNPKSIERIIINLVENARRYGKPPVILRTFQDSKFVYLSVIDHGEGLTQEEAAHLLKPFTRKNHSRTGIPGTGLGLAIVDKIVRLHNATLQFKKYPGQHFEVRILFPLSQQRAS
ncbi:HAMP domain-containing protein [Ferrovum sp. PN-J185]|uniref:ATP-binding protein n=1 Tax=Ferrovum sp. PN-J185 TaxID=1356306 RepID=UPI00079239B7|nr:ATP-binding protein [Ferrovum sp. PN-J185]KXW56708.1 osmolarity sensor protein EnvZ [Ferrovum sp. PN-J185]MCC6067607.1 HAMP domain-containing protein [Ferrovum sp. PN-J185]MDE1892033.1 HAMP domain-containing protein [Betaproteobacteria bacterium]MDE2056518.1 HAMP domain-containing protein [Betaproteobacteria bacterium]